LQSENVKRMKFTKLVPNLLTCLNLLQLYQVSEARTYLIQTEDNQMKLVETIDTKPVNFKQRNIHGRKKQYPTKRKPKPRKPNNRKILNHQGSDYGFELPLKKKCLIHAECGGGQVCTNDGTCRLLPCKNDQDCKNKVSLPTKCYEQYSGGPLYCDPEISCESDNDCTTAGQNFRCQPDVLKCKPTFGKCHESCDCVENYGMQWGEAICSSTISDSFLAGQVCMCRSPEKAECFAGSTTITDPALHLGGSTDTKCKPKPSKPPIAEATPRPIIIPTLPNLAGEDATTTTTAAAIIKPPVETPSNRGCQIHAECGGGEVCTREGQCVSLPCNTDQDCKNKVALPSKCYELYSGGPLYCDPEISCESDTDCKEAGENFRCQPDVLRCKPSFGKCGHEACDCVNNYGMQWGEAICTSTISSSFLAGRVCMCRTPEKATCYAGSDPTIIATTPPPEAGGTDESCKPTKPPIVEVSTLQIAGGDAPVTTTQQAFQKNGCPVRSHIVSQQKGDKCWAHTGCFEDLLLICAKSKGQGSGTCKEVSCNSDGDCMHSTSLPSICTGGVCARKHCYAHSDCPQGYGCDGAGMCKKNYGSCEYDCDCGDCGDKQCFQEVCFCKDDSDVCSSGTGPYLTEGGTTDPECDKTKSRRRRQRRRRRF